MDIVDFGETFPFPRLETIAATTALGKRLAAMGTRLAILDTWRPWALVCAHLFANEGVPTIVVDQSDRFGLYDSLVHGRLGYYLTMPGTWLFVSHEGGEDLTNLQSLVATTRHRASALGARFSQVLGDINWDYESASSIPLTKFRSLLADAERTIHFEAASSIAGAAAAPASASCTVNIWLTTPDKAPAVLPLAEASAFELHLNVGPRLPISTVVDPRDFPPRALRAAREENGIWLDVTLTSANFAIGEATPDGPAWATSNHRLRLNSNGSTDLLVVGVRALQVGKGFVRALISWRNQILQVVRMDLAVGNATRRREIQSQVEYAATADFEGVSRLQPRDLALTCGCQPTTHTKSRTPAWRPDGSWPAHGVDTVCVTP